MDTKTCFIIMPFTEAKNINKGNSDKVDLDKVDLEYIYVHIFKRALDEFEFNGKKYFHRIERFEEGVGSIIDGVIKNIYSADIVIADLTSLNPNVMYELGVRHSVKRGTIIVSQDLDNLPSDLRDYLTVGYSYSKTTNEQPFNYDKFKIELHKTIRELIQSDKYDSPVLKYFKEKQRFRNEDQIDILKENAIIIDLICEEYEEIEDMIKVLIESEYKLIDSQLLYQLFNIKLSNLSTAINELKITHTSSIFYQQITNSKSIISEVSKIFSMSQYFSAFKNEDVKNTFAPSSIKDCIEKPILNIFELLEGNELSYTNMEELFSENGILENQLIDYLEEYVDAKSIELGIESHELDKVLTS